MGKILASQLNKVALLQQPVRSEDNIAGADMVWGDVATVWVATNAVSIGESVSAGRVRLLRKASISMRNVTDVAAGWQLVIEGVRWRVIGLASHRRYPNWVDVQVEEVAA